MKKLGMIPSYITAIVLLVYTWVELVPHTFYTELANPAHFATLGGVIGFVALIVTSIFPPKDPRLLHSLVAQVLASMPVFYLWGAIRLGNQADIAVEAAGLFCSAHWPCMAT